MNSIEIKNFGPIRDVLINLDKDVQIYIGAQASGKSTICKVIYFCRKIRDYTLDFLLDSAQFRNNHRNEYFNNYRKFLTKQFMGCFGKTRHMQRFSIVYIYKNRKITIGLNSDGYVRFSFDTDLNNGIQKLIDDASNMFLEHLTHENFANIIDNITALGLMKKQFREALFHLFADESDIIYIPAGRSLLAIMSEQLHDFSISDIDLTMQEFINLIRVTKNKFGSKIPEMIMDYTKTVKGQINNNSVEQAYLFIKQILKADYTNESDGEKIYFDQKHWVKLMYSSSGQQEVLWILMLLFVAILENKKSFIVIEEPEAHLFPIAQKDIINLIALMINTTKSSVIITTHSPYILTSMNILLYSAKIEKKQKNAEKTVVAKNLRISFETAAAYKVTNRNDSKSNLENLLDEECHLIDTDYIDEVSSITNKELDLLISKELRE